MARRAPLRQDCFTRPGASATHPQSRLPQARAAAIHQQGWWRRAWASVREAGRAKGLWEPALPAIFAGSRPKRPVLPTSVLRPSLLVLGLALAGASQAREYHYGALDNPALLACEDLQWSGQRDAASNCYRQLSANLQEAPQIRAEALWAL